MGEDMDVFTMDNTDMPKIDQQDTREELEPHFSPSGEGRGVGRREGDEGKREKECEGIFLRHYQEAYENVLSLTGCNVLNDPERPY